MTLELRTRNQRVRPAPDEKDDPSPTTFLASFQEELALRDRNTCLVRGKIVQCHHKIPFVDGMPILRLESLQHLTSHGEITSLIDRICEIVADESAEVLFGSR